MASGYPAKLGPATAPCSRCKRLVLWVTLAGSGKRAAVDTGPDPLGEVHVLTKGGAWAVGLIVRDTELRDEVRDQGFHLRRFHSDTCTNARKDWRDR